MAPVARPTSRLAGTLRFLVHSHIWGLRPLSPKVSTEPERVCVLVIRQFFAKRASRKRQNRRPGNVVSFRPFVPHRRAQKISPSLPDSHYTTAKSCEPLQVPSLLRMVCCKNKLLARDQLALAAFGAVVWHCTGQPRQVRHRADEKAVPTLIWNMARVCGRFR